MKLVIEVTEIDEESNIDNLELSYLFEQILATDGCIEGEIFDMSEDANRFWYKISKKEK